MKKNNSYSKPVSIVMIAYNEAKHIERIVLEYYHEIFMRLPKGSEFVFYLDKPTDDTPKIVRKLAKDRKLKLKIVEGKTNLGYAGAMKISLTRTKNNIVFYSDSSSKHRAKDFWELVKFEKDFDIVTGFRVSKGNPLVRQIITLSQRVMVAVLFNLPMHDFNSGYKIIHQKVIKQVVNHCQFTKQSFSTEMIVRAIKMGMSVKDVPVVFKNRSGKNTGANFNHLPATMYESFVGLVKLRLKQ